MALCPFIGKEPNLMHHLDWAILSHQEPQKQELVKICTWGQIYSKDSNRKMAIETLKINYKTQK
jgi:hypothetical protein